MRSVFLHCWDLEDRGVDQIAAWAQHSGLNTLCLAANYHSGWLIHPSHSSHRAFLTEGSVCYFRPRRCHYSSTVLRPKLARMCRRKDWFAEAGRRLGEFGLRLVAWTIGCHNSWLSQSHPQAAQRNLYGDHAPHALCPANPQVRAYLKALCRDLAVNHPIAAIQLEAFGWMRFAHGHHHERDLVGLQDLEQELLSLCFCAACERGAAAADIDVGRIKATVRGVLEAAFRAAPARPRGHPDTMAELESRSAELRRFNRWRRSRATSLIAEIRNQSLAGTPCQLWVQVEFDEDLAGLVDGFACIAYGRTPASTRALCRRATGRLPQHWAGLHQCLLRLGMGTPANAAQLRQLVEAVRAGGCDGVNFYNLSEAPPRMLGWLAPALAAPRRGSRRGGQGQAKVSNPNSPRR